MIKIAICDDETYVTTQTEEFLAAVENTRACECDIYYSGEALYQAIEQNKRYDLIYLDIELGGLDGIATARKIREIDKHSVLIFITAYDQYAIEAFEVESFRFT
ncbi:MAG: response regulator [Eubacteriales bacterium]